MVLEKQDGPNWFKNWCVAPIIVYPEKNKVYCTPLYYAMVHFSKFMRPNFIKIGFNIDNEKLMATAVSNPDISFAMAIFNPTEQMQSIKINSKSKNT